MSNITDILYLSHNCYQNAKETFREFDKLNRKFKCKRNRDLLNKLCW